MKQTKLARLYLMLFGGMFFLISCVSLIRFYAERNDIWWTPMNAPVSLEESRDRVEIYARGMLLQDALRSGRLQFVKDSGPSSLTSSDIGIRLNNRDRVKVMRIPEMIVSAVAAGFTGLIFLFGVIGWIPSRLNGSATGDAENDSMPR